MVVQFDFKDASLARAEGHFCQFVLKSGQELLSHPGRAHKPAALSAIMDLNAMFREGTHQYDDPDPPPPELPPPNEPEEEEDDDEDE